MAEQKLTYSIEAVSNVKKGLNDAKNDIKSFSGASGSSTSTFSGGIPSPIQQSLTGARVFENLRKQSFRQTQILMSIDKNIKLAAKGGGLPGKKPGVEFPGKKPGDGSFPGMPGKGVPGLGKLGKIAGIAGIAGIVGIAAKEIFNLMGKASAGYRQATTSQLESIHGMIGFRGERGGVFDVDRKYGVSGSERARFYAGLERGGIRRGGLGSAGDVESAEVYAKRLYAARGVSMDLSSKIAALSIAGGKNFSDKAFDLSDISLYANRAGMRGLRTQDYAQNVSDLLSSRKSMGLSMSGSGNVLGMLSAFQKGQTIQGQEIGVNVARNLQNISAQGGALKGGAGGSFALGALMQSGMGFKEARNKLQEGGDAKTFQTLTKYATKMSGGNEDIRNIMLRNMGLFDPYTSDKNINDFIAQTNENIKKGVTELPTRQEKQRTEQVERQEAKRGVATIMQTEKGKQLVSEFSSLSSASMGLSKNFVELNGAIGSAIRSLGDMIPSKNNNISSQPGER